MNQADQVREMLAQLEDKLEAQVPDYKQVLRNIHVALKKDPDIVTVLSDEECNILVEGLKKQTKTEIATTALKKKTKASSKMTLDDI